MSQRTKRCQDNEIGVLQARLEFPLVVMELENPYFFAWPEVHEPEGSFYHTLRYWGTRFAEKSVPGRDLHTGVFRNSDF